MAHSPWYILGPCSAETREQTLLTARQLKEVCGDVPFIYRAGAWKPRTSPHTFQGAGDEALGWLQAVQTETGLPVATEVASPEHVRKALEAGIDYLWIGARTSANPLATQAIADAIADCRLQIADLKGILIKNPVNADAALWLGNIERLEKTGVPVVAVHRGCNHQPCWSMAHTVRLARPDIPMLLDPSHMSGDAKQVPALLRKVDELGLDGAMIEVHCQPEAALSDKQQQIRPKELGALGNLGTLGNLDNKELLWLRAEIDELDNRLWATMAARMDVSRRIGEWKKAHGVAPLQPERVKEIGERLKEKGEKLGLSEAWMLRVWELIHEESLKQQK